LRTGPTIVVGVVMKIVWTQAFRKLVVYWGLFSLLHSFPVYSEDTTASQTTELTNEISESGFRYRSEESTTDDNGEYTSIEVFQGEGEDAIITSDYIAILTMFAAGAVTGAMINAKPLTADIGIGAGAGVAFVAGEVLSTMNHNEDIQVDARFEVKMYRGVVQDHEQIMALEQQKAAYEKINETSQYKLYLQGAAAAGYLAAAGMAMSSATKDVVIFGQCQADIAAAEASLTPYCTSTYPPTGITTAALFAKCELTAASCLPNLTAAQTAVGKIMGIDVMPGPSTEQATELMSLVDETNTNITTAMATCNEFPAVQKLAKCQADLQSFKLTDVAGASNIPVVSPVAIFNNQKNEFEILQKALEFIFPSAHAGPYSKYGLGAAGAGLLLGMMVSSHEAMDQFVSTPSKRAILWAALAALAGATAYTTYRIMEKMKENIQKIDDLLNRMRKLDDSYTGTGTVTTVNEVPLSAVNSKNNITSITPEGIKVFPCAGGGTPPCTSIDKTVTSSGALNGIDPAFSDAASLSASLADSIQGKSSLDSGTIDQAASLAGKQSALKKKLDALKSQLNNFRTRNKLPAINFKAQESGLLSAVKAGVRKQIQKNPAGAKSLLGPISSLGAPELGKSAASSKAGESTKAINLKSKGIKTKGKKGGFFNLGGNKFNSAQQEIEDTGLSGENLEESPDDIVSDNGASLWQIITVRYMKSGLPRLLDLEEGKAKE